MPVGAEYDVFLCHNRPEKDAAAWLAESLRKEGLHPFLDRGELVPGASLPAALSRAFAASRCFAVILGTSGLSSGYQGLEIDMAVNRATQDDTFRIIVVLLPGGSATVLPAMLAHRLRVDFSSSLEDSEALAQLVAGIRGAASAEQTPGGEIAPPAYRSLAPPTRGFVPRSELAKVVQSLTSDEGAASAPASPSVVALTTALRGAGGFGKTALAQAVCEAPAVRRRFPAGILWTTLGQHLTEADRLARVSDLLRRWLMKDPPAFESLEAAAGRLREVLSGRPLLLVLDDVWLAADVELFAGLAPPAGLLLTTRNTRSVPHLARSVVVDALELPQAVELLGQGLEPPPPTVAMERLTRRLGEWPILLRLVNAQLHEEYRAGLRGEAALRQVENALDEIGLTAFDREDEEAREKAVRRTVEASLQRLAPPDREKYGRLAVFAEDQQIPLTVLALLWNASAGEAHRLCHRFYEMSLLYSFDAAGGGSVQLHDVMRAYLLHEHDDMVASLHSQLADRWLEMKDRDRPQEMAAYFVARLPYHLKESGRIADLERLLFSYAWLGEKVTKAGVNAAMADYQLLPHDEDAERMRQTLRLARAVLTREPAQLPGQLYGRLAVGGRLKSLLEDAAADRSGPWLKPLLPTLEKSGGPFAFTFQAHRGEVRAMVQLDGEHFATAGSEGEIRVWSFLAAELSQILGGTGGGLATPLRRLARVSPTRLLAGGDDGCVRLWNLEEGVVIRTFTGPGSPVTALRLRREVMAVGHENGALFLWEISSERPPRTLQGHEKRVTDVGFLDDRTLVSISADTTLRVWQTISGRQLRAVKVAVFGGESMEVTGSNRVIVGVFGNVIQIWKPHSQEMSPRRSIKVDGVGVDALSLLRRDLGASTVGGMPRIALWNPSTGTAVRELHVPGNGVTAMAKFEETHLLCGAKDGSVSALSIDALANADNLAQPMSVFSLATVGPSTVVSTANRRLRIWQVGEAEPVRELAGHTEMVSCVCTISADRVASSSSDGTIRIWNLHTGELLKMLQIDGKLGALTALAPTVLVVAPTASLGAKLPIQFWDLNLNQKVGEIPPLDGGVAALCVIGGRFLIIATFGGLVYHFDISAAKVRRNFRLSGHEKGVACLAVLDQDHIASGSLDRTVRIWNLTTQEPTRILTGHTDHVTGLAALSARLLASGSADRTLRIWDVTTGAELTSLEFDAGLSSLTALPDGRTLVAGDGSGQVHFLRLMQFRSD